MYENQIGKIAEQGGSKMNEFPTRAQVELKRVAADPQAIPPRTCGKVLAVDAAGQLLMKWDNGCLQGLYHP